MKQYSVPIDYTWNTKITTFDAGKDRRLRLSSQLKLQQEVGELQFQEGKLGYEKLYEYNMAFVLTRLNTVIYRAPILDENVQIRTWYRCIKGVQFFRCYQFLDTKGNTLIDSVTAFALVDINNHSLLRPSAFDSFNVKQQPNRFNSCPDPCRLKPPTQLKTVGERSIRWSDIDYNGHVNNAVYADIVCDVLPGGMDDKCITGFSIAYLHEALEGENLLLKTCLLEKYGEKEAWVIGNHSRGRCFDASVRYKILDKNSTSC